MNNQTQKTPVYFEGVEISQITAKGDVKELILAHGLDRYAATFGCGRITVMTRNCLLHCYIANAHEDMRNGVVKFERVEPSKE